MNNKFLTGGVIAGVLYFLIGWVVWGILLKDFMASHAGTATGVMKADSEMVWWALIVGNLFSGFALSYVLNKAGANTFSTGAVVGGIISLLIAGGFDFTMLGVANLNDITGAIGDIVASAVVGAIIGGITAVILNKLK